MTIKRSGGTGQETSPVRDRMLERAEGLTRPSSSPPPRPSPAQLADGFEQKRHSPVSLRPAAPHAEVRPNLPRLPLFGGVPLFTQLAEGGDALAAKAAPTTSMATPAPLNPDSVARANQDFEQSLEEFPTYAAALSRLEANQHDPDYVAQFVSRLKEGAEPLLDQLINSELFFRRESGYAHPDAEPSRELVINSLRTALERGTFTDADVRGLLSRGIAGGTEPARDVVSRLGFPVETAQSAQTLQALGAARAEYDRALGDYNQAQNRLQRQLANFGHALTKEQQAAYINAFWEDPAHAQARAAAVTAGEQLSEHLRTNAVALEDAAIRDPQATQALYETLRTLAVSPSAGAALELAGRILSDSSSPLGKAFAGFDVANEVLAPAMPNAAAEYSALGTPEAAFERIKQIVGTIKDVHKLGTSLDGALQSFSEIGEVVAGKFDPLGKLTQGWQESPLMRGLEAVKLVFAAQAVLKAPDGEGRLSQAVSQYAALGQGGLKLVSGAIGALSAAGRLAQFGRVGVAAGAFAHFGAHVAPGLGALASGASAVSHLEQLLSGGDPTHLVSAVGDALSTLGSAMLLFPGLQAQGGVLVGLGAAISIGGQLLGDFADSQQFGEEQRRYLAAAGVDPDLSLTLIASRGSTVRTLIDELDLRPAQVQQLGARYPGFLQTHPDELRALQSLTSTFGLNADQTVELLLNAGAGLEYPYGGVAALIAAASHTVQVATAEGRALNREAWLASLEQLAREGIHGSATPVSADAAALQGVRVLLTSLNAQR